jgi:hypothetical protein
MDHSTAETLLESWLAGSLPPERAAEVEAHVRSCAECAVHADLVRALRREIATHGAALFTPHPASDQLALLTLEPGALSLEETARLGAHLRACPACAAERDLIRASARPAPLRALAAFFAEPGAHGRWLRPALAVALVLLLWPAWLGVVEYPRAKRAAEQARAAAERAAAVPAPAAEWNGGGAGVLILSGPMRGGAASLPESRLRPGQPGLSVVLDHRLETEGSLRIVLRDAGGREVWSADATARELWDEHSGLTSLMVPARVLPPGAYALAIGPVAGPPEFQARFRILP